MATIVGALILFDLLALLFAACNHDGDSEEISVEDSGINSADTSDSGNTSVDESTPDYFDNETSTYHVYTLAGLLA